jgi:1,2-diacylglycerol 3-alpha-glucosyltransferase
LGDGALRPLLEKRAQNTGAGSRVEFRGNVQDVETYMADADIYVHTARTEPFGLVLIEAMAAGLPVITLDGGGNRDLIRQGENGFLLTREDPVLFADHILSVWQDKTRYLQMAHAAQAFARHFDIGDYVQKLMRIYTAQ